MGRHYPPAVRVHGLACPDVADKILPREDMAVIARERPNAMPHLRCLSGGDRVGRIEIIAWPEHPYQPSSQRPKDAERPTCTFCHGTHGPADALLLPPGAR